LFGLLDPDDRGDDPPKRCYIPEDSTHLDRGFSCFPFVFPGKCWDSISDSACYLPSAFEFISHQSSVILPLDPVYSRCNSKNSLLQYCVLLHTERLRITSFFISFMIYMYIFVPFLFGCFGVYNTTLSKVICQNYWVFGPFPLSGILGTRKHGVSETGCFHPQVWGEDTYSVGSLRQN
jgi:hypothetical protein